MPTDEPPLDSVRAVRLLRAKVNELERQLAHCGDYYCPCRDEDDDDYPE